VELNSAFYVRKWAPEMSTRAACPTSSSLRSWLDCPALTTLEDRGEIQSICKDFYQVRQGRIWSRSYKSPPPSSPPDRFRFSSAKHNWSANLTFLTTTHVIYVKFDVLDHTLCHSCQIRHSWSDFVSIMSNFYVLDQILWFMSNLTSWLDLMSFMSNSTFLISPCVIHVKFDLLDYTSCHSCQIWRCWPTRM
jgi:hypothetical protein